MWHELMPGVYEGRPGSPYEGERLQMRARLSGLPPATQVSKRLACWEARKGNAEGFQAAKALAEVGGEHPFLALVGQPGTGKTHLAMAVGWEFIEGGRSVAYWQVEALLDTLRQGYVTFQKGAMGDVGTPEPYRTLNFIKRCALLILDDLGAHRETEWSTAKLDEVVDHRYIHGRALVVTTNDLAQMSPRIRDRLRDGTVVMLKGASCRGRQRSKEAPEKQEV